MFAIMSNVSQTLINEHSTGLTAKGIKSAKLKLLPIPVPPLSEQQLITARINELMGLCDRLKHARALREATRDRLAKASYARLSTLDAKDVTFRSHVRFIVDALPTLTARADQIRRLRQTILELAVQGKLVKQESADEPASILLRRIEVEKSQLVKEGKIKEPKPFAVPIDTLCELPMSWSLVPLGAILVKHLGGGTPSKSNKDYWNGSIPWASVKDVGKSKYLDHTIDCITEAGLENSSSNLIEPNNLVVVTRMGLGKVSINRIFVSINQDLRALILSDLISINYAYKFLLTHGLEGTGLTVKGIKLDKLLSIPFPLPPVAEQHRIVAKVDELLALCNQLEVSLGTADTRRQRLLESLLLESLEPAAKEMELA